MKNQAIVLFQDEVAIQKLTEGTSLIAQALTKTLNEYRALDLPIVVDANQLLRLKNVESFVKQHFESSLTDDDLQVKGLKLNRKKLADLLELPDFSKLEKATLELQDLLNNFPNCRKAELYKLVGSEIQVDNVVFQKEVDSMIKFANENQAQFLQALELIEKIYNEQIIPTLSDQFIYVHPNSLESSRRYILESDKFFKSAFEWNGSNRTLRVNKKIVAELVK